MFLIHRGHTVSCAAQRHLRGGEILRSSCKTPFLQSNRQVQPGPLLRLPLATPVTKHRPLQKGFPVLADRFSRLFQHFCAQDPWKRCPVGTRPPSWAPHSPAPHTAAGSSSLAKAERDGTFFGTTSPNPWSVYFVPFIFFFSLFVTFSCVRAVPDKLCLCL